MKYDKIRGASVPECMMKVRKNYGSDAIILATREVREGGLLGSGLLAKKMYEIEFMVPEGNAGSGRLARGLEQLAQRKDKAIPLPDPAHPDQQPARPKKGPAPFKMVPPNSEEQAAIHRIFDESAAVAEAEEEKRLQEARLSGHLKKPQPIMATPMDELDSDGTGLPSDLTAEEALHTPILLPEVVRPNSKTNLLSELNLDDRSERHFLRIRESLLASHLSEDFAANFLRRLDHNLSRSQKQEFQRVSNYSKARLAEMIQAVPDIAAPTGQCRAVLLMGPTGSGKTTTLAKIAARYYESRDISIYSLDHYRLAATEQLKTYASVMEVPFHAPIDAADLAECLRRDGAELILIDSSGIGHRDQARLERLHEFMDSIRREVRLDRHLCLAANTSETLVEKILLAYDRVGFDKLILTKLDEADFIGAFIELADKFNRPFSYITNGQEVPNDISEARSAELARLVFEGAARTDP